KGKEAEDRWDNVLEAGPVLTQLPGSSRCGFPPDTSCPEAAPATAGCVPAVYWPTRNASWRSTKINPCPSDSCNSCCNRSIYPTFRTIRAELFTDFPLDLVVHPAFAHKIWISGN